MTKPPNFVSAEVGVDVCVEMPSAQPNKLHLRSCCCIQFNCDLYNLKAALVECNKKLGCKAHKGTDCSKQNGNCDHTTHPPPPANEGC